MNIHDFTIRKLRQFKLIEICGLDNESGEKQKEFLNIASDVIIENTVERVEKELSDDKKEAFLQLFVEKQSSEKEKTDFLEEYVPNFIALYWEEFLIFKEEMRKRIALQTSTQDNPSYGLRHSWISRVRTRRDRLPIVRSPVFLSVTAIVLLVFLMFTVILGLLLLPIIGIIGLFLHIPYFLGKLRGKRGG